MTTISGKAQAILQRLPHFYDPQEVGELALQFINLFGRSLDRGELDIYQVLRAHHVETADNVGSQGYTAPVTQRGDLDKIFALYLESIGGTTQLVKMTPRFSARSFHVRRLTQQLNESDTEIVAQIKASFRPETSALLARYRVEHARFLAAEIQPGFVLTLLVGRSMARRAANPTLASYIRGKLSATTRALLDEYAGGDTLDAALQAALAEDLNHLLLRDSALYRKNASEFEQLSLSKGAWLLLRGIYGDFLRQRYADETDEVKKAGLLAYLDEAQPCETPPGDDLVRLNRMLLEAAFAYDAKLRPWGLQARQIPTMDEVRQALLREFNRLLVGEELFRADWFPDLADDYPALRQRHQNGRAWLNRLILEATFPLAIEKSYTPYQERMRGLIQVLRRGASTREGIIDLVAANLGIVDNTPADQRQRQRIRIEEFAPIKESKLYPDMQPHSRFVEDNERTIIRVNNPNLITVTPEIHLSLYLHGHIRYFSVFTHWAIINRTTGQKVLYEGALRHGDWIRLSKTQTMINGLPARFIGGPLTLPPGESILQIETLTGLTVGRFDRTLFDTTTFVDKDDPSLLVMQFGRFDETNFDEVRFDRGTLDHPVLNQVTEMELDVEVSFERLTLGEFRVDIPWDLGDFPADSSDPASHPRNQIRAIIDKVKAAGVFATINYEKNFSYVHDLGERGVTTKLQQPLVENAMAALPHLMQDRLHTVGVFDYSEFDSLNSFANDSLR